jgi:hypothetical protein
MTLLDLYREHGFEARKKTPAEWSGPCPACGGTDRFQLFAEQGKDGQGRYWCRQCEASGDRIQFLRDFQGMGFKEAARALGMEPGTAAGPRQGVAAPAWEPEPKPAWTPRENVTPGPKWQAKAFKLVAWAAERLAATGQVLDWLRDARGLTAETVAAARLGWIPKDTYRAREAWGLPSELNKAGKPKKLWIPEGLTIPVFGLSGKVERIKFRRPHGEPKYIPIPTDPKNTAPMLIETGAKAWAVVESELDVLLLAQEAGELVNVMALGSASYAPDATAAGLLDAAPYVLLCLDYDDAGQKKTFRWWSEHYPEARPWPVPEGKDVCDAWAAGWPLADWIKGGLPPMLLPRPKPVRTSTPQPSPYPAPAMATTPEPGASAAEVEPTADDSWTAPMPAASVHDPAPADPRPEPQPASSGQDEQAPGHGRGKLPPRVLAGYKKGRAWIMERLPELEAKGWTRAGLFRAGRYRHPYGQWGLAWSPGWSSPDLARVELLKNGGVLFTLWDCRGGETSLTVSRLV